MMDQSDKGSQPETMNSEGLSAEEEDQKKSCADCGTTKTPLWRGGPAGPKSLCNACGIRSRKKRRALLSLKHGGGTEEKKTKKSSNKSSSKFGDSIERRVWDLGREVVLQRSSLEKQRKKQLGEEEEQAAVLLMSLSYGSVYA